MDDFAKSSEFPQPLPSRGEEIIKLIVSLSEKAIFGGKR
jgi:hypothetical protein